MRSPATMTPCLNEADVIVAEGVSKGPDGKGTALVRALTLSYRIARFNRKLGLVEQQIDYSLFEVPVLNPDVTAAEFEASWQRLKLSHRLMMYCLLPVVVLGRLFGGTKALWTKAVELEDLPTAEAEELSEGMEELDEEFGGERDDRLHEALSRLHRERGHENVKVAIGYGAGHVTAMVGHLMDRHGYRPRSAEWLTVAHL
ncbi:hypothetical protein Rhe02_49070 [Rhizocola hellebori]|uniref:Uncharacterized protein n=1 Tax=Rhizocola hellebori TaxID=1392758 RepID=A0A8J3QAB7_9ACTN|nr:hypothetical protein [Rhizocola hellebori]GIH06840.1 hypothetical protein Rhe02_49070 [Rhizocola hellebori]